MYGFVYLLSHLYNQFCLKLDHCIIQFEFSPHLLVSLILVYHSGIMQRSTDMVSSYV